MNDTDVVTANILRKPVSFTPPSDKGDYEPSDEWGEKYSLHLHFKNRESTVRPAGTVSNRFFMNA